jgi:phage gp37-like protein
MRIDEAENAVLGALQADPTLASMVKTWMAMPAMDEETLARLVRQYPAVGVISPDGEYDYRTGSIQNETATILVLCIHRNLRSPTAALRGGAEGETGAWEILDLCRAVLLDWAPGSSILKCLPVRRSLLFVGDKWSAVSLEIKIIIRTVL